MKVADRKQMRLVASMNNIVKIYALIGSRMNCLTGSPLICQLMSGSLQIGLQVQYSISQLTYLPRLTVTTMANHSTG